MKATYLPSVIRVLLCCIAAVTLVTNPVFADFSGGDSLAGKSDKWTPPFDNNGGAKLSFANSRLEYSVKTPTKEDMAALRWAPNEGGYSQDWFIQVDVHMDTFTLKKGAYTNLNLGVINTENQEQGLMIAIDRYRNSDRAGKYVSGIESRTIHSNSGHYTFSNVIDATLRLHFDSSSKTLTSSWKAGGEWKYFKPVDISAWSMDRNSTFAAVLVGSGGNDQGTNTGPATASGKAYFSNFKSGAARPVVAVEQPTGSTLIDGERKRSFGTATIIGGGVTKTFVIRNNGTTNIRNLKITKSGSHASDFNFSTLTETVLEPGAYTTFKVTFSPKASGTRIASIQITSNDPEESPFDIQVAGQGVE